MSVEKNKNPLANLIIFFDTSNGLCREIGSLFSLFHDIAICDQVENSCRKKIWRGVVPKFQPSVFNLFVSELVFHYLCKREKCWPVRPVYK